MRFGSGLSACPIIGLIFWLADSLLLSFSSDLPFAAALWSGVPAGRLLLRLILLLILLLVAVMCYMARVVTRHETLRVNKADNGSLFGDQSSELKARRLVYYSLRLATLFRMRTREQNQLRNLCYCYDIGLIGVPEEILDKGADLTREEQVLRDRHIDLGVDIAMCIPELKRTAPLIACHEEYYNGRGAKAMYGRSIPLACRIFMAVLVFDYYTQSQQGKPALSVSAALDELDLRSGSVLDPEVVAAFRRLLDDRLLAQRIGEEVFIPQ